MEQAIDHTSTVVLNAEDVRKGMYVSYLDRPWLDTTFPFKGFEIKTDKELKQLRATCEYVFINAERGSQPDGYERFVEASTKRNRMSQPGVTRLAEWDVSTTTEDEFRQANSAVAAFRNAVIAAFGAATRQEALDIDGLREAAKPLRRSVERCPDAALFAIRMTDSGDYLYRHAVACAVMGLIMGRALGLPGDSPEHLAVGCALLDIGKTRVPAELLNSPNTIARSSGEMVQLRRHVKHSVELVSGCPISQKTLLPMIAAHHERHKGHGYPEGLQGEDIPLSGRIAGIVDFYDAMISQRAYGRRATPNEAMRYIRQQRGRDFCPLLTDQFLQVFRLYPTGALVELSDGTVGRVIQQNPKGLLTPRVHLILDHNKQRLHEFTTVDLSPIMAASDSLCISECLKPGAYSIEC